MGTDSPCQRCGKPVYILVRGKRKRPESDHDLCRKCWRGERDRNQQFIARGIGEHSYRKSRPRRRG